MRIKFPDYDNSLLSITASILQHYGAQTKHKSLPLLDEELKKNYKNVVVMLFDGMGVSVLNKHLKKEGFFRSHIATEISSVFPPTTTAATTTIETGLSPMEHGWLGWSLYFEELDANVSIFPNTLSGSDGVSAAAYNVAQYFLPATSIFEKIMQTNDNVEATFIAPFTAYNVQSVSEIRLQVNKICAEDGRKYVYTYWHHPDYDMHTEGIDNAVVKNCLYEIESEVASMCAELKDTLVIVTADHGMLDTESKILTDYPEIESCLVRKPSVEPRALSFFVKKDHHQEFEKAFIKSFGKDFILMNKEEVFKCNLFGSGDINPRTKGFIGDYLAIAIGSIGIESQMPTTRPLHKASHAGLTANEMTIPLIIIDCK